MANTVKGPSTRKAISQREQIAMLENQIAEMQNNQRKQEAVNEQILAMLGAMTQKNAAPVPEAPNKDKVGVTYLEKTYEKVEKPAMDELIKITSTVRGQLVLSYDGTNYISFSKFGESQFVLYSELVKICNQNKPFIEAGYFYIEDDRAVYYLGLSNIYKNLLTPEEMNSICDFSKESIKNIFERIPKEQAETVVKNIAEGIYRGIDYDRNKTDYISNISGLNINSMVSDMEKFAKVG